MVWHYSDKKDFSKDYNSDNHVSILARSFICLNLFYIKIFCYIVLTLLNVDVFDIL